MLSKQWVFAAVAAVVATGLLPQPAGAVSAPSPAPSAGTGTWTEVPAPGPVPRTSAAMAYDAARAELVLTGGFADGGDATDTWVRDSATRTWTEQRSLLAPEGQAVAMAYDPVREVSILFGGVGCTVAGGAGAFLAGCTASDQMWQWDGSSWTRLFPASSPPPVAGAALAWDPDRERIVLFGGHTTTSTGLFQSLDETWEWDGTAWARVTTAHAPSPRGAASMAFDPVTRRMILFGGGPCDTDGCPGRSDTWSFDGTDWTELQPSTSPPARWAAPMAPAPGGAGLVLFGGVDGDSIGAPSHGDTWTWNGRNWSLRHPVHPPPPASYGSMAFDSTNGVSVMVGGANWTGGLVLGGDTWEWDGVDWTEFPRAAPAARSAANVAYHAATGEVLMQGGDSCRPVCGTWTWDGTTWTERFSTAEPVSRLAAAMAYSPRTRATVLFGGRECNVACPVLGDTWEWDGSRWERKHPQVSPPPLVGASAVQDPLTGDVILFGGVNPVAGAGYSATTWRWDGRTWTALSPPVSPPARADAAFAFDAATGRAVLFGGQGPAGTGFFKEFGDTWTWDGTTWTEQPAAALVPRSDVAMATDPVTGRALLFGGNHLATFASTDQTMLWNGATWDVQESTSSPSRRDEVALAGHPPTGTVVLFGGAHTGPLAGSALGDTWLWRTGPQVGDVLDP